MSTTTIERQLGRIAFALETLAAKRMQEFEQPVLLAKCEQCGSTIVPADEERCPACRCGNWKHRPGEGGFTPGPD